VRLSDPVRRWFWIPAVFLLGAEGCSLHPVRTVVVSAGRLQERADVPRLGDDWGSEGQMAQAAQGRSICRVKYHPSYRQNRWMVVEGTLGEDRTYPVVLDTGASPALFVNDIHVVDNGLAIHPLDAGGTSSGVGGICVLPRLQIGDIVLLNWSCFYAQQHPETQVFGLTIARDQAIVAGVPALRKFRYIAFDSINQEVEFSLRETFDAGRPDAWSQYAFVIEEDLAGNAYLFVEIPIAGEPLRLQLDTGSGRGLAVAEELWERIRPRVAHTPLRATKELYPYLGCLDCKRGVVPRLSVGDRFVTQAQVSVFPDDSPLLEQAAGLLGMQYFQDTILVLDFQRHRMWVRNVPGR